MAVFLSKEPIDPSALLAGFQIEGAGAIASFTGLARGTGQDNAVISSLVLQSYRGVTLASMQTIAVESIKRFSLLHAHITHRSGRILPNEPIVFVAAAALHRAAALDAVSYMMDLLKTEAVFWKYEETAGEKRWIEPTEADYARAQKWNQ